MKNFEISIDDVINIKTASWHEALDITQSHGAKFFAFGDRIHEALSGSVVGSINDLRVYLEVPYSHQIAGYLFQNGNGYIISLEKSLAVFAIGFHWIMMNIVFLKIQKSPRIGSL